jgi:hypothetical protein
MTAASPAMADIRSRLALATSLLPASIAAVVFSPLCLIWSTIKTFFPQFFRSIIFAKLIGKAPHEILSLHFISLIWRFRFFGSQVTALIPFTNFSVPD